MAPIPTELDPIAITLKVTSILESLQIPYFISGSLASSFHGMVRTTQDADVVAKLDLLNAAELAAALQDDFFVDEQMVADAVRRHSSFNILHRKTMFKVDLFFPLESNLLSSSLDGTDGQRRRYHPLQVAVVSTRRASL
jgi:hypothetical protein